jgi:hypothetical protein
MNLILVLNKTSPRAHTESELNEFNGCFDPQRDLQLIAEAKHGFIEALHRQNCPLWVAPERFPH